MIPFRTPRPEDREEIAAILRQESIPLCNYSFPVLYCWKDSFRFEIAVMGQRVLVRLHSSAGHAYLWPAGTGDPEPALQALAQDAAAHTEPLRMICLTTYHRNWLENRWPGRFTFSETRDGFDYIYNINRLADLSGKKLHSKRNHIHRFDEHCPGWTAASLTQADIPDCIEMDNAWLKAAAERESHSDSLQDEHRAIRYALDHWEQLGLEGCVLRWNGRLLAFSLGAPITDTIYDIHFERAIGDIQGDYAAINRSFARQIREQHPEILYLNREDDMGVEGLRKAKLSYYPDHLEINFYAESQTYPL